MAFFWAGRVIPRAHRINPMYVGQPNAREVLYDSLRTAPGFYIVNSAPPPSPKPSPRSSAVPSTGSKPMPVSAHQMLATAPPVLTTAQHVLTPAQAAEAMRNATFCWVPPGQRYGDARRHLVASFVNCVPVFTVPNGEPTLAELVPWDALSLDVPVSALPQLPALLRAVGSRDLARMRRGLACARRFLWYASLYGACAEGLRGMPDAFDGLMAVLAARLEREGEGSDQTNHQTATTHLWKAACETRD
jgi:hypothetical protein